MCLSLGDDVAAFSFEILRRFWFILSVMSCLRNHIWRMQGVAPIQLFFIQYLPRLYSVISIQTLTALISNPNHCSCISSFQLMRIVSQVQKSNLNRRDRDMLVHKSHTYTGHGCFALSLRISIKYSTMTALPVHNRIIMKILDHTKKNMAKPWHGYHGNRWGTDNQKGMPKIMTRMYILNTFKKKMKNLRNISIFIYI